MTKQSPDHTYALIMAGGEGTRFSPLSTPERPKQFLNFIGQKTFIRQTFDRVTPLVSVENIYISTNEKYVSLVEEQLPELLTDQIVAEPFKRNTAPALSYCSALIKQRDGDATIICLPSDHYIEDEEVFRRALAQAVSLARDGYLVTLGMEPTWASPDYGYIKVDNTLPFVRGGKGGVDPVCHPEPQAKDLLHAYPVTAFVEKPDSTTAARFISDGDHFWNGGIFVWKAGVFFSELKLHAPDCAARLDAYQAGSEFMREYFRTAPSISIDCAVMEKSGRVAVIPVSIGWSDVGTWEGLHRLHREEMVAVDPKVLRVMREALGHSAPDPAAASAPRRVEKPWGYEEVWAHTDQYVGKMLFIRRPHRLSLQYHRVKDETVRVVRGVMELEFEHDRGRRMVRMSEDDAFHIPAGATHRMTAIEDCLVVEVSTPYLGDIVRLHDDYQRG